MFHTSCDPPYKKDEVLCLLVSLAKLASTAFASWFKMGAWHWSDKLPIGPTSPNPKRNSNPNPNGRSDQWAVCV